MISHCEAAPLPDGDFLRALEAFVGKCFENVVDPSPPKFSDLVNAPSNPLHFQSEHTLQALFLVASGSFYCTVLGEAEAGSQLQFRKERCTCRQVASRGRSRFKIGSEINCAPDFGRWEITKGLE